MVDLRNLPIEISKVYMKIAANEHFQSFDYYQSVISGISQ